MVFDKTSTRNTKKKNLQEIKNRKKKKKNRF